MAKKKENKLRIEDARVERIKGILHEKKMSVTFLSKLTNIRHETLYRILNGIQPLKMNTLEIIAKALDTPLIAFSNNNELDGIKFNKGSSFEVVRSIANLFIKRDKIVAYEYERMRRYKDNWERNTPLLLSDFKFRENEEYDTSQIECWSFNSGGDKRDDISLKLGNMVNGFGVCILGIQFPNSEVPYQLAIFDESPDALEVQRKALNDVLINNGLKFKRKYIYSKKYEHVRRDLEFENGKQMWCYEWMKYVVWEKCKQNKEFQTILLSIPRNAIIIEQAQKKDKLMWGCWNEELKRTRDIMKKTAMIENCVKRSSKKVMEAEYRVNNVGVWVGQNAMGKILTMCKICLYDEVELPIDVELLNDAKINWFGKQLVFSMDVHRRVEANVV